MHWYDYERVVCYPNSHKTNGSEIILLCYLLKGPEQQPKSLYNSVYNTDEGKITTMAIQ
jgi:hypothetical protein